MVAGYTGAGEGNRFGASFLKYEGKKWGGRALDELRLEWHRPEEHDERRSAACSELLVRRGCGAAAARSGGRGGEEERARAAGRPRSSRWVELAAAAKELTSWLWGDKVAQGAERRWRRGQVHGGGRSGWPRPLPSKLYGG
ncbi:unnamed protein product [Urochloa humidicola]